MDKASPADVEVKDNVTEFDGFRNFLDREKPEGYVEPEKRERAPRGERHSDGARLDRGPRPERRGPRPEKH